MKIILRLSWQFYMQFLIERSHFHDLIGRGAPEATVTTVWREAPAGGVGCRGEGEKIDTSHEGGTEGEGKPGGVVDRANTVARCSAQDGGPVQGYASTTSWREGEGKAGCRGENQDPGDGKKPSPRWFSQRGKCIFWCT